MDDKNLITVTAEVEQTLNASSAKVFLRVSGQAFFSSNQALKKAEEVRTLVEKCEEIGIEESKFSLVNVHIETESGFIGKSTTARYDLIIDCQILERLGQLFQIVSISKNVKLHHISWIYDNLETVKQKTLEQAVKKSKETGLTICQSLDCQLNGVHKFSYQVDGIENDDYEFDKGIYSGSFSRAKYSAASAFSDWNFSNSTLLKVSVNVDFLVSGFHG